MSQFNFSQAPLDSLLEKANTLEALDHIEKLWDLASQASIVGAEQIIKRNSFKFLKLAAPMLEHINFLAAANHINNDTIAAMREQLRLLHSKLHNTDKLAKTFMEEDSLAIELPEDKISASTVTNPVTTAASQARLNSPVPLNSRKYSSLATEYLSFFQGAFLNTNKMDKNKKYALIAIKNKERYQAVGEPLNIPWWFIAALHLLESSYNYQTHLHNGDPLKAKPTHVPKGRPNTGSAPFTWEQSATDALKKQKLDNLHDWCLSKTLFRWECYNGLGYRSKQVPSPYLWSFTSIYSKGKYIADGKWDENAKSAQCGAVALLKAFIELKVVSVQKS